MSCRQVVPGALDAVARICPHILVLVFFPLSLMTVMTHDTPI